MFSTVSFNYRANAANPTDGKPLVGAVHDPLARLGGAGNSGNAADLSRYTIVRGFYPYISVNINKDEALPTGDFVLINDMVPR